MSRAVRHIIVCLIAALGGTVVGRAQELIDSIDAVNVIEYVDTIDVVDVFDDFAADTIFVCADSLQTLSGEKMRVFNPDPARATWLSVLCPGLGQIYNRRYWKLPIVIGGFMGLIYATSWNNTMLTDYTTAYNDIMDNDPDTKSYMNFFAPGVSESQLSQSWLQSTFQSRKNYFRRNRDLCIVGMIAVYLVAIVDAYVDAALAHFDISPDLSLQWSPTLLKDTNHALPGIGVQWALCF